MMLPGGCENKENLRGAGMNNELLLDTDIIVNVGRGDTGAVTMVSSLLKSGTIHISAVTEMELVVGCRNKAELRSLLKLLERFTVVHLTPEISTSAVTLLKTYRLSHGLLIADALIAATALVMGRVLVSGNTKHFSMIKNLQFRPA
jgi:predicted nucleic acid-binding protein